MRILIAPDKYKGSLTALQVSSAIEVGLLRFDSSFIIEKIPLADGGEGSLGIIQPHLKLASTAVTVKDPLERPVKATYMYSKTAAFIELAAASGINLLDEQERNCLITSTYGTGQLILDAFNRGLKQIYLFVGGSATNDGGIGILSSLGVNALGDKGVLPPIGVNLSKITSFDSSGCMVGGINFTVVCDVMNPLYGPTGAAFVYAPQKGADAASVELLDQGLRNLAKVIRENHGKKVDEFEGAGAAGGIAAGLKAFFPVKVKSGIESIIEIVQLSSAIESADLVITGEGKLDHQTLQGKVIKGVRDLCLQKKKKLAVICGVLDLDETVLKSLGFWKVKSLVGSGISKGQAIQNAFDILSQRAFELFSDS